MKAYVIAPLFFALLTACGSAEEAQTQYAVVFESTQAAVVTEGVKVFVFDAAQPNTDCASLTAIARETGVLPTGSARVFESPMVTPCDLLANAANTRFSLGLGPRTVFAEGFVHGAPVLVGCNAGTLQDGTETIQLPLGTIDIAYAIPATTCTQLSQHCEGKCP